MTRFWGFDLSPRATHADRSFAIDNAIAQELPHALRLQCWNHVGRKFTEGNIPGVQKKRSASFHPCVVAIKNCRTAAQAKAVSVCVLRHMRENGGSVVATWFEREYLCEQWFKWYIGYGGPGFPPTTNPQESWHKIAKGYPDTDATRRPTDELLHTVFPQMLHQDGLRRGGRIVHASPDVRPGEYVAGAQELDELPTSKAYIVINNEYWVKYDWSTQAKKTKSVTSCWVAAVRRGLEGNINPERTPLAAIQNHYLGLCRYLDLSEHHSIGICLYQSIWVSRYLSICLS